MGLTIEMMERGQFARAFATGAVVFAVAGVMTLASPQPDAAATDQPSAFEAVAQAGALRISVVKPAALPTSDELAALAIPFAHAETSSAPVGRAIGSWLWPGETAADVKSLLLVGLDPGADEEACRAREAGEPPRRLASIPNPAGGEIGIDDPQDNPCGSAGFKQIMAGQIDTDPSSPTYGQRRGGVVRAMPDYPFWARAQYPANADADATDRTVLCQAPGALPEDPWRTPREACPPGGAPESGLAEAAANASRNAAQSALAQISAGMVRTGPVWAASNTAWRGNVLVASTTVTVEDLALYAADAGPYAVPWIRIEALRATAVASSDGRSSSGALDVGRIRVAIPTLPSSLPCSSAMPCEARLGRDGLHVTGATLPAELRNAVEAAFGAVRLVVPEQPLDAAGLVSAGAGGRFDGPGVSVSADRRSVVVGGLAIDLATTNSAEGRTILRLTVGGAAASATTAQSPPLIDVDVPIDDIDYRPPAGRETFVLNPTVSSPALPGPGVQSQPVLRTAARSQPASLPIPPGLMLLAVALTLSGAAALVAFGVWESIP